MVPQFPVTGILGIFTFCGDFYALGISTLWGFLRFGDFWDLAGLAAAAVFLALATMLTNC